MKPPVYLDYAAGCPMGADARDRLREYQRIYPMNPHGGTCFAAECRRRIAAAERRLLELLGLEETEAGVVWTSGATEALNLAMNSAPGRHLWIDAGAHPAMLEPARRKAGDALRLLPLDRRGGIDRLPDPREQPVDLIGVCDWNNETGARQDPSRLATLKDRGPFLLCLDAAQSFGHRRIDFRRERLDYLVVSSRKIGGPVGLGALVHRAGCPVEPLILGGGQQSGLRSGTLDTAAILLFRDRLEQAPAEHRAKAEDYRRWNSLLRRHLAEIAPEKIVFYSPENAAEHILYFGFRGFEGALVTRILAQDHAILVSSGSACSAEKGRPSPVLAAMGFPQEDARWAVRLSMGASTSEIDVQRFLEAIPPLLENF